MKKIPLIAETFRLTAENSEYLDKHKEETGENKSKFINRLIEEYQKIALAAEQNNKQ